MPTLIPSDRVRRKTTINLHDKQVVNAVSVAISRTRSPDVQPKDCRNDAKTVVSAYVLGQDAKTAAQRLLTWYYIDCGMNVHALSHAPASVAEKVIASANAGYAALEAIEKYGNTWIDEKPADKAGVAGIPGK